MTEILCSGADLASVCAEVRARGGSIEALETRHGGRNSGYRLEVFYGSKPNVGLDSQMGGKLATSLPCNEGDLSSARTCRLERVGGTGFKLAVAPLRATANPPKTAPVEPEIPCPTCGGSVPKSLPCPICSALQAIQARVKSAKRLFRRKPSTNTQNVRTPYAD